MTLPAILAPVLVQVLLTFVLLFWMGRVRIAAVRAREVRVRDVSLGERAWPPRVMRVANAFHNQFELPVLFYALVPLAILTRKADLAFVVMSWLFVATRIVHAGIYAIVNRVPLRFAAFVAGALILLAMWIIFAVRILVAPGLAS